MENTISLILSGMSGIICGGVLFFIKRYFMKKDKEDTAHNECKIRENMLILRSINAVGKLTVANTIALRDGKTNGETTTALAEYEAVEKEMYNYLLDVNAKR